MKRKLTPIAGLIAMLALAAPSAQAAGLPNLKLNLTGKKIIVSGAETSGAVNVTMVTKSSQGSAPLLIHLNPGVSFAKAFAAIGDHNGDPNYLDGYAQIDFSYGAPGAGTTSAQTLLTPGRWVALDTENNNPKKWPMALFTVTKAKHPRALPHADASVNAIEFGFTGPSTWHDGETIRFSNAGFLVHMIAGVKVKDAADAATVTALLKAGQDSKAQALATGFATFIASSSPGGVQQEKITASPGIYVLVCFMDTQDGREHTTLGMEKTITITG